MRVITLLIIASFVVAAATPAVADTSTISLGIGSDFPVSTGLRAAFRTAPGFEFFGTMGTMPDGYLGTINDVVVGLGGYDREVAALVEQSLGSSMVMTVGLAIPLFSGIKLRGAYGIVGLGGSSALSDIAAYAINQPLPISLEGRTLSASSTLQIMTVGFGGNVQLHPYMGLHLGIGGAFTAGASSTIETNDPAINSLAESYLLEAEEYLDDIFTSYGHSPFLSFYLYFNL